MKRISAMFSDQRHTVQGPCWLKCEPVFIYLFIYLFIFISFFFFFLGGGGGGIPEACYPGKIRVLVTLRHRKVDLKLKNRVLKRNVFTT